MINYVYQLVSPKVFSIKYTDLSLNSDRVIIRPNYMALCHADQRYFLGQRDIKVLNKKLPMALIHECCGIVEFDPTGTYKQGQKVVMIPNTPVRKNPVIFENYDIGSYFLSSGHDGFMREFVDLPVDRVVPYTDVPDAVAAITEFISVGVHASTRFDLAAHEIRDSIGIWGDGSLAYAVANVLKLRFPNSKLYVIGMDSRKLTHFSFVDGTHFANNIPEDFRVDHA
ncbi:MAG: alcohol dehydrogenase catalytic domain-containing protein, partial [Clostridia bacterium]|nr:alcohol dehydrogenase catalytic domain-containing protein [Clostridia bacterium]